MPGAWTTCRSRESESDMRELIEFKKRVHATARAKGWWDKRRETGTLLMLITTEIAEAMEAVRQGNPQSEKIPGYSALTEELADVMIRTLDLAEALNLPLVHAMLAKAEYNESRTHRHGGKEC